MDPYVGQNIAGAAGKAYVVRIAATGLKTGPEGLKAVHFRRYPVATRNAAMHRIIQGPDKAMGFTEMQADEVGG